MVNIQLTQELVKELFIYKDGELFRTTNSKNKKFKIGDKVGCINGRYYSVKISSGKYLLHRVIFLYHKGYLPEFIDHKDLNKLNNRIENLREATKSQNCSNSKSNIGSISKYKGVTKCYDKKTSRKWRSRINYNKKQITIGYHITENEAALAYNKAAVRYHKEFAYLNIIIPIKA